MPKFSDIPQFTRMGNYAVDHSWAHLPETMYRYIDEYKLNMEPDFQRGYIWATEQKQRFVEYGLRGGNFAMSLYFNCPGWHIGDPFKDFVIVDGKQRLSAVLGFMNNEFPVLEGYYFKDYTDKMNSIQQRFRFHINDLQTRAEVLQWYLDLNTGGTVHADDELDKVRRMIQSLELS